jgi:RNA polymerase sigma factor (sigma-70 family)
MSELTLNSSELDQFKSGDQKVFKMIHDHFFDRLTNFADKKINDPDTARDIVNKQLTKLWTLRSGFDSVKSIKAFLYISTRNACFDHIKKRNTETRNQAAYSHINKAAEDPLSELELVKVHLSLFKSLDKVIEELPTQQRNVIKLIFENRSTQDIANILGITAKTVLNLKYEAIKQIQEKLLYMALIIYLL